MNFNIDQGTRLVKAARFAISLYLTSNYFKRELAEKYVEDFNEKQGVFVTLYHYPTMTLRGCIGFPIPIKPLKESLIDAAIAAATEDPRFVPVTHMELKDLIVEVNVLSPLELIRAKEKEEIKKEIKIGKDGLMIKYGYYEGLFLPEVPVEEHWNVEEYLENLCIKAGLPTHMWYHEGASLYKFTSQIFREIEPDDGVKEIVLSKK